MTSRLALTPAGLREIADALDMLTTVRREQGVAVAAYGRAEIRHITSDTVLRLSWSNDTGYTVDDNRGD